LPRDSHRGPETRLFWHALNRGELSKSNESGVNSVASQVFTSAEGKPSIYESAIPPTATGQLDRIVFARLSSLGFRPVLCSDAVFIHRAYLDLIGTLPTAQEAREFIQDPDAKHKCTALINHLLERDEFADCWATRCDVVPGLRPLRGLRRLADHSQEPVVYAVDCQPCLVLAARSRHHPQTG